MGSQPEPSHLVEVVEQVKALQEGSCMVVHFADAGVRTAAAAAAAGILVEDIDLEACRVAEAAVLMYHHIHEMGQKYACCPSWSACLPLTFGGPEDMREVGTLSLLFDFDQVVPAVSRPPLCLLSLSGSPITAGWLSP